jgi:hypothetical protein
MRYVTTKAMELDEGLTAVWDREIGDFVRYPNTVARDLETGDFVPNLIAGFIVSFTDAWIAEQFVSNLIAGNNVRAARYWALHYTPVAS